MRERREAGIPRPPTPPTAPKARFAHLLMSERGPSGPVRTTESGQA
jgi:hypothetical protein